MSETGLRMKRAIAFRATAHKQDFLPMSKADILKFEGCSVAWASALADAGITLDDLSFVETHDCFTIAELIEYEAMGLTPRVRDSRAVKEGWTQKDGRCRSIPSGGLKAKGHPIGATGVSMHVLSAMQLAGEAEGIQIKGRHARRHLQHGRRGSRELRLGARTHQMTNAGDDETPAPGCCRRRGEMHTVDCGRSVFDDARAGG